MSDQVESVRLTDELGDRELLKLAAKATGEQGVIAERFYGGLLTFVLERADGSFWKPLADDGDALRLAVQLEIEIVFGDDDGEMTCMAKATQSNEYQIEHTLPPRRHHHTRRAIVRAAAAIGRAGT